jgi:iron complex transport system substrate-binding protein
MPFRLPAAVFAALLLLVGTMFISMETARSAEFVDSAGRHVVLPDRIGRIMPAEPNAEVLVFVVAPRSLVERGRVLGRGSPQAGRPPVIDWAARSTPAGMAEAARRFGPDLIIDAGPVTPDRAIFANQVTQLTGIPYILVEDSFARMPKVLRTTATIVGVDSRRIHDLFIYAEHAIADLHGRLLIRPANERPHVYFARGPDRMTTALPGSPAGEAIDEAGAINVAGALGRGSEARVSREQLLEWNPEIIIADERGAYDAMLRNPAWRRLSAVRNKRVYLQPTYPFGWIDDPSGVNRLIGLYWLSTLFYPDATQEDLRASTCDFYDKFYAIKLTNTQLEAMVRPAGAPPPEALHPIEPLVGLGAALPVPMPPGAPGATPAPGAAPENTPAATCALPTAPTPYLPSTLSGEAVPSETAPPAVAPGVPPPGRRGRPLGPAPQQAPARRSYQYQTRS